MSVTGVISNISRCSVNDGPGVRTVVYFKGCNLRCKWCHNPELISFHRELAYFPQKCIFCGRCMMMCPKVHIIENNLVKLKRECCTACGKCADECPANALELIGKEMSVDEVFTEVLKDRHFFNESGGGVTFSGGECLLQADFSASLAERCKKEGIHTAVETSAFCLWSNIEKMLPFTDLFFTDLKIANSEKHRSYTSAGNELIIENIRRLSSKNKNIIVRIPVIPNVNDSAEDFDALGEVIKTFDSGIHHIELLKYNNLAKPKYDAISADYTDFAAFPQHEKQMKAFAEKITDITGVKCIF